MKIIRCDNYGGVADRIVASDVQNKEEAEIMLMALRAACPHFGSEWYLLVEDDHPLWGGHTNLTIEVVAPESTR